MEVNCVTDRLQICYSPWMLLRLRRWASEICAALLLSTFILYIAVYQTSVLDRPRAPVDPFGFPYSSKFGVFYVSRFEIFVLDHFFEIWFPLFAVGILLKATYRGYRLRYDPNRGKVVNQRSYEEGDVSARRFLAWLNRLARRLCNPVVDFVELGRASRSLDRRGYPGV